MLDTQLGLMQPMMSHVAEDNMMQNVTEVQVKKYTHQNTHI